MKHIKSIFEYTKAFLLPKDIRYKNLLYHSTDLESFESILKTNKLYGTDMYDYGVATSRNKHYMFGRKEDGEVGHNLGEVQLILDKDKLSNNYKINPFDWEELKRRKSTTGEYHDFIQSEDKILTDVIENIDSYIIGLHIVKNDIFLDFLHDNKFITEKIKDENWIVFDEDWLNITDSLKKIKIK